MSYNPFFIIIDGIDGSGKTTLSEYISKRTQAVYMKAFGQGPIGSAIRGEFLKDIKEHNILTELNWVLSANLESIYNHVIPSLKDGKSVVLDRFLSSTYAYQIHRLEDHFILNKKVLYQYYNLLLAQILKDLPVEPLYLWCDVSVENSVKRINQRNEKKNHFDIEDEMNKQKTIEGFKDFYQSHYIRDKIRIDCNPDLPLVISEVDRILNDFSFNID